MTAASVPWVLTLVDQVGKVAGTCISKQQPAPLERLDRGTEGRM